MTQIPKSLIPVSDNKGRLPIAKALFYFEDSPNQTLEIYKKPFRLSSGRSGVSLFPGGDGGMRMDNLGWYVRQSYKRDNDLWGMFSRESIMSELKDSKGKIYEVSCDQTFALLSKGIDTNDAYFLIDDSEKAFKDAFYFGASELLRKTTPSIQKSNFYILTCFTKMNIIAREKEVEIANRSTFCNTRC